MDKKRVLGYFLCLVGIVIIGFNSQITGNVIGSSGVGRYIGFVLGLAFVIGGCVVLMARKDLGDISAPTSSQLKAIEKMANAVSSGKNLTSKQTRSLSKKAGYEFQRAKGDHQVATWGGDKVRNLPGNSRRGSVAELDMGSKSYNPRVFAQTILYDFRERRFPDHYDQESNP